MSIATPGVYVQEISKFPPSVASVETAIPAFIGYTEKAKLKEERDLIDKPTRISSMLEYEAYFGFAELETSIVATVVDSLINGNSTREIKVSPPSSPSPFLMYYSMQMYFANGGGPCYIVAVDTYKNARLNDISSDKINNTAGLNRGLQKIAKEDEPTLLLFPDATSINDISTFFPLYQNALNQCNKLMDRFTIIDTYNGTLENQMSSDVLALRNGIVDNTKYGASYYPFLETVLNYNYNQDTVEIQHFSYEPSAVPNALEMLNNNKLVISPLLSTLIDITTDVNTADITGLAGSLFNTVNYLSIGFKIGGVQDISDSTVAPFILLLEDVLQSLKQIIDEKEAVLGNVQAVLKSTEEEAGTIASLQNLLGSFKDDFEGNNNIEKTYANLVKLLAKLKRDNTPAKFENTISASPLSIDKELAKLLAYAETSPSIFNVSINKLEDINANLISLITGVSTAVANAVDKNNGELNGRMLSALKALDNNSYNIVKSEINKLPVILPPSSTMAGVYARVDNNRGVWKAPANVGVNYVIKPAVHISHEEQSSLNVHTTGKSINAIRSFIGKGTLVWGARTLAGNDNEWRYVPVRRFFNYVEESVKKATEQFVFEPNDKNTWVKVKAMISNFLTLQWKAGALAGPTPNKAFYVKIGLNETMTTEDVLEGKLIVEIGMAAVRPAEFIILRFSHQLQEA